MRPSLIVAAAAAVLLTFAAISTSAYAHEFKLESLEIKHPWSRATPPGAKVGGGYLEIVNRGTESDRFLGGSTPAADKLEIHESTASDGVARMRPVKDGLVVEPGATVKLAPGGTHLMLLGLKGPLKKGEKIGATLVFEKAGSLEVEFAVDAIGGPPPAHDEHGAAQ